MPSYLVWLIAAVSIALCLLLWFRDVRRIMRKRLSMVKSAAGQLAVSREKADARGDRGAAEVLARSENIYRQAADLYHQEMKKPWIRLPALLMGFRRRIGPKSEE